MKKKKQKVMRQAMNNIKMNNLVLLFFAFLFFVLLIARCSQLSLSTIIDGKNLKEFASSRTTANETIYAKRGTIYDTNGEVLAQNVFSYTLIAYLDSSRGEGNYVEDISGTATKLAPVLGMTVEKVTELLSKDSYQTEFGSAGKGLTEIAKDAIVALNLDGIDFTSTQKRYYPKGDFLSYTLGYAKSLDDGSIVGEMGLEQLFNSDLTGTNGSKQYQKDLRGYKIANTKEVVTDAKDGDDIYLTIDYNIQFFVEQALDNADLAYDFDEMNIVVADATTGAILGMSSTPSFDPNLRNMTKYLDPNTSVSIEPGSTMKIFSYMAAMEAGVYNGNATYNSGTYTTTDGTVIGDWNRNGWGNITFDKGFALSSNVGVVNLIRNYINKDILQAYFYKLGFGSKTGMEVNKETAGDASFTYETEVYNAGFGQGITTTAIQNIKALTSVANDGMLLEPYIVDKVVDNDGNVIEQNTKTELGQVASKTTTDKIKALMEDVVTSGTGTVYNMPGYGLIAKTGTAQISSTNGTGYLTGASDVIRGFAGMFPKEDPQILIYATLKQPNPNSPAALAKAIKEIVVNIGKYKNIYSGEDTVVAVKDYTLESYVNKDTSTINTKLTALGLKTVIIGDGTKIISQYPSSDTIITSEEKIYLVTNGKNVTMPNIVGWSVKEVKNLMKYLNINYVVNGTGYITAQSIAAGTAITSDLVLTVDCSPKFTTKLE